ncbi:MAG: hypothetical protein HQL04_02105 [Nitrospirae bacterium]|nr:hypothetical protein [Nitrospirota bacterium]
MVGTVNNQTTHGTNVQLQSVEGRDREQASGGTADETRRSNASGVSVTLSDVAKTLSKTNASTEVNAAYGAAGGTSDVEMGNKARNATPKKAPEEATESLVDSIA